MEAHSCRTTKEIGYRSFREGTLFFGGNHLDSTEEYERARKESTSGRFLLDVKRSGKMKARGIKQGFKEDKETADGFDFNYYLHMAKLTSARTTVTHALLAGEWVCNENERSVTTAV